MSHVFQRVANLRLAQRSPSPIGSLFSLERLLAQHAIDNGVVRRWILVAAEGGGKLYVENMLGGMARGSQDEIQFLASGVEDDDSFAVGKKLPQGFDVDFLRVDNRHFLTRRNLDQTEFRIEGVFRDKLRVDAKFAGRRKSVYQGGESLLGCNWGGRHRNAEHRWLWWVRKAS